MVGEIISGIAIGICGLLVIVALAFYIYSQVKQRRMPMEERRNLVARHLQKFEKPTGVTAYRQGIIGGVEDDMVRDVAKQHGYEWTGYTGRNDVVLNFQRHIATDGE
jgi:hypothetical protein